MPDFQMYYVGTVTFDPLLDLRKKQTLIESFSVAISSHLHFSNDDSYRYYLSVAKEYHKVGTQDDLEAPHIHFTLQATKSISSHRYRAIQKMLKDVCGRSQFFKATTLKFKDYSNYILKDCDRLYALTGESHYYEMNLERPPIDYDWDVGDDYAYLSDDC